MIMTSVIGMLFAAQLGAAAIVQEAMRSQGEDWKGVEIMEVDADHWFLNRGAIRREAVAARTPDGGEIIVVSLQTSEDYEQLIQHETAHLIAWRRHGERIKEHGREFKRACRAVVTARVRYFCDRH